MRFFFAALFLIAALFFFDTARAMVEPMKGKNGFCQFDPYNKPVLSFSEYDAFKKLKTKKAQKQYLTDHMKKQCGYVPQGSVK